MNVTIFSDTRNHQVFIDNLVSKLKNHNVSLWGQEGLKYLAHGNGRYKSKSFYGLACGSYKSDLIVIDEIFDKKLFLLFLLFFKRKKVHLCIHNVNSWFYPRFKGLSLRNLIIASTKRFYLFFFKNIIVVDPRLKVQIPSQYHVKYLSFASLEPVGQKKNVEFQDEKFRLITIPGMLGRGKKYELIIDLVNELQSLQNVKFCFLGRPIDSTGFSISQQLKNFNNTLMFNDFIEDKAFECWIMKSEIIISDFDLAYDTPFGQREYYGESKATGVVFWAAKYRKKLLLPEKFFGNKIDAFSFGFNGYSSFKDKVCYYLNLEEDELPSDLLNFYYDLKLEDDF